MASLGTILTFIAWYFEGCVRLYRNNETGISALWGDGSLILVSTSSSLLLNILLRLLR